MTAPFRTPPDDPLAQIGDVRHANDDPLAQVGDVRRGVQLGAVKAGSPFGDTVEDRIRSNPDLSDSDKQRHINLLHENRSALAELGNQLDEENNPGLTRRIADALYETGKQVVTHPLNTAAEFAKAPIKSAMTAARGAAEQDTQNAISESGGPLNAVERTVKPEEGAAAAAQTMANVFAPELGKIAAPLIGAAYSPDDPLVGAGVGTVLGTTLHKAGEATRGTATRSAEAFKPPVDDAFKDLATEMKGTPPVTEGAAHDNTKIRTSNFADMLERGANEMPFRNKGAAAPPSVPPLDADAQATSAFDEALRRGAKEKPGKVTPIETQGSQDAVADEARARAKPAEDAQKAEDLRQEELTRQAALRWLTGVRRRPGGIAAEGAPIEANTEAPPTADTPNAPAPTSLIEQIEQGMAKRAGETKTPAETMDDTPHKHDFSSTQINLPPETATAIKQFGETIPDSELAKDGREDTPHVTVKYGLHGNDPEAVRKVIENEPPITATLGKTSIFPNGESNSGDVLKADVDSPDLHRLNAKIADALPHTDTHPEYKPHATIAYLKAGEGAKYVGDRSLEGHTVTIDHVTFSDRDGKATEIPLKGAPGALPSYPEGFSMGDTEPRIPEIPKREGKPISQIGKGPGQYLTKDQVAHFAPEEAPASTAGPSTTPTVPPSLIDQIGHAMKQAVDATPDIPNEPVAKRIKRAPRGTELSDDSRYADASRRPIHLVSVKGLVGELVDLEDKHVDAARRSAYNFTPDDNFHSTEDGRSVLNATRRHNGEVSEQAKALQNIEDYKRIDAEVMTELQKARGLPRDVIDELVTRERDARAERQAMKAADDRPDAGDTSFDFGDEPTSFDALKGNPEAADRLATHDGPLDFQPEDRTVRAGEAPRPNAEDFQSPAERAALARAHELLSGTGTTLPDLPEGVPKWSARLLNERKFDQSPEIQNQLRDSELRMGVNGVTKQRVPLEEGRARVKAMTRDALVNMGLDPTTMDLRKVGRLSGEEIVAFKQHATQLMDEIAAISKHLEDSTLPDAERTELTDTMEKAIDERDDVLERVVRAASQKGRDLNFLRQVANRSLDPDVWVAQARRIAGDTPLSDATVAEIRKLARDTADACGG